MSKVVRILVSHALLREPTLRALFEWGLAHSAPVETEILVDSGGFTNELIANGRSKVAPVTLAEFIAAARQYERFAWRVIQLDKINDAKVTKKYLEAQRDAGLNPMPVVTGNAPPETVNTVIGEDGWVSIGGLVGSRRDWSENRICSVYEASGGTAKIHALGYSRMPRLLQLPVASVDATNAMAGLRFANVYQFQRNKLRLRSWRRGEPEPPWLRPHLARHGIDGEVFSSRRSWHSRQSIPGMLTLGAFLDCQRLCWDRYGVRLFLSGLPQDIGLEACVMEHLRDDGTFDYPTASKDALHRTEEAKKLADRFRKRRRGTRGLRSR